VRLFAKLFRGVTHCKYTLYVFIEVTIA